ncbi:hypothetical protein U3516DRAFT_815805 [Neocallimastix sp. 'constans']
MDEREAISRYFESPEVIVDLLKRVRIEDNKNIADFTYMYRKMYDCLPTEYVEQFIIKDYLNSLDLLREITKLIDWENSRISFWRTLACIKEFKLRNIRKRKINNSYKNNQYNQYKKINKLKYIIKLSKFLINKGSNKLNKIVKNNFSEYHSLYKAYNNNFRYNKKATRYINP